MSPSSGQEQPLDMAFSSFAYRITGEAITISWLIGCKLLAACEMHVQTHYPAHYEKQL